jgi:hypothetical protein
VCMFVCVCQGEVNEGEREEVMGVVMAGVKKGEWDGEGEGARREGWMKRGEGDKVDITWRDTHAHTCTNIHTLSEGSSVSDVKVRSSPSLSPSLQRSVSPIPPPLDLFST